MFVAFTFAEHVFSRSQDAQSVADQYRGLMSRPGLADLRSGFEGIKAAGAELDTQAEPALRQRLHSAQSHALSDSQVAFAPTFANANKIPLTPIRWMFIGARALLVVLARGFAGLGEADGERRRGGRRPAI